MRKTIIKLALLCFVFSIPFHFQLTSHAQSITVTQENFDYDWYLAEHPDVYEAFGADPEAIWNFYVTLGEPAGWYGRPSIVSLTSRYSENTLGIIYSTADKICSEHKSQYDRALAAHDWLCNHVDYDYSYKASTVEEAILNGLAVCQGYAVTYDLLAELCGINCEYVRGTADNGSGRQAHAWNKVTINGTESYIDCTWDDFTKGFNHIAHDCFMITEEKMDWIHDGKIFHFMNNQPMGYY